MGGREGRLTVRAPLRRVGPSRYRRTFCTQVPNVGHPWPTDGPTRRNGARRIEFHASIEARLEGVRRKAFGPTAAVVWRAVASTSRVSLSKPDTSRPRSNEDVSSSPPSPFSASWTKWGPQRALRRPLGGWREWAMDGPRSVPEYRMYAGTDTPTPEGAAPLPQANKPTASRRKPTQPTASRRKPTQPTAYRLR